MERTNDNGYIISGSTSKLDIDSDPFIIENELLHGNTVV